jgi:hypothetical protein
MPSLTSVHRPRSIAPRGAVRPGSTVLATRAGTTESLRRRPSGALHVSTNRRRSVWVMSVATRTTIEDDTTGRARGRGGRSHCAVERLGVGRRSAEAGHGAAAQRHRAADAFKRLLEGNERYVKSELKERDSSAGRAARVQAQYPFAATLSCADSRVTPADRAEVLRRQEDRHRGRRVRSRQRQDCARVTQ